MDRGAHARLDGCCQHSSLVSRPVALVFAVDMHAPASRWRHLRTCKEPSKAARSRPPSPPRRQVRARLLRRRARTSPRRSRARHALASSARGRRHRLAMSFAAPGIIIQRPQNIRYSRCRGRRCDVSVSVPSVCLPLSAYWQAVHACSACRALLHAAAPHPALATCGHDARPIHAGPAAMTGHGRGHRRAELLARGIARRWARAVVVWCAESSSSRSVGARVIKQTGTLTRSGEF